MSKPPNQPTSRRRKNRPVDFPLQNAWTSPKGTEIILRRTILSSANSIHPSILTTRDRPHYPPETNYLQPTRHTRTAPPTALSKQVCHLLNTNDCLLGGTAPSNPCPSKICLVMGLLTKQPTFSIRQLAGKKKDAPWRHPNHFIILLRFKAVAERRQWSSAAPKPRRKTRVRLCPHF